jgi:WASH complex subunit 7
MRLLAADKLGLALMDNFLPMGSLEQGLDVLQIMRNIHVFVARFAYNMNMQVREGGRAAAPGLVVRCKRATSK